MVFDAYQDWQCRYASIPDRPSVSVCYCRSHGSSTVRTGRIVLLQSEVDAELFLEMGDLGSRHQPMPPTAACDRVQAGHVRI